MKLSSYSLENRVSRYSHFYDFDSICQTSHMSCFWAFRDTVLNVITPWSSVVSSSGPTGGRCIELLLLSMFSRSYVSLKSLQCRLLWSANRHSKQNTHSHLLFRWSSCYNKCLELAQDGSEMDEGPSTCFKKWKRLNFLRFSLSSQ